MSPRRAMVLAAGRGERLRPLTDTRPKPLVEVAGRALIDHALDRLAAAGVTDCVVNACYLGHMIERHLAGRRHPRITISREQTRLETGGGVARALPHLGPDPFYTVNADVLWDDGRKAALARLAEAWDDEGMDILLMLVPRAHALGYAGAGDFHLDDGRPRRRRTGEEAPYVYTGVQIMHPRAFAHAPGGAFSLNRLFDRAMAAGRLGALVHDAAWYHVGTAAALADVQARWRRV